MIETGILLAMVAFIAYVISIIAGLHVVIRVIPSFLVGVATYKTKVINREDLEDDDPESKVRIARAVHFYVFFIELSIFV